MTKTNASRKSATRYRRPAEMRPWYKRLRWGDFVVTGLIIVLAIALLLSVPRSLTGEARVAVLSADGRTVYSKPLVELQTAGSFSYESQGYHYTFSYENGRIRFSQADCPDQVCVRTGWVVGSGQMAACVPGHLILKITGRSASNDDIDIIMQ